MFWAPFFIDYKRNEMKKITATIIGASGYTGVELIRVLLNHKNVVIKELIAESNAGNKMGDIYSHLKIYNLPKLIKLSEADFSGVDVIFCCLPHATSQKIIKDLPDNIKIIDLSADFRLHDVETYAKWYGNEHAAPQLQKEAVYGLTELNREQIKGARIVACPGCYPTSATLPLLPLVKNGLIETNDIIIDAKTGVTGAGRSLKQNLLYTEVNEGIKAYSICNHRHMPEMEQTLSEASQSEVKVNFTPQLVPMNRGILSTIYVKTTSANDINKLHETIEKTYKNEPFVHILALGELPSTQDVYSTNHCIIGLAQGTTPNLVVIVSVIDNLTKGSSGQAVQNMNVMFDLNEKEGLEYSPVFP